MIFKPELVRAIRTGKKTQTRRKVKTRDGIRLPCPYKVGRSYAIQRGRGQEAEPETISIVDVHTERAGDISYSDARREGFRTTDDFKAYWVRLYDGRWIQGLEGENPTPDETLDPIELVARFEKAHAATLVYVISFRLDEEPRYLAPAARPAGTVLGYTHMQHQAMPDEPEAIDAEEQERQTKDARSMEKRRTDNDTRSVRSQLEANIADLAARPDIGRAAARRLDRMRRDLQHLERELRAA